MARQTVDEKADPSGCVGAWVEEAVCAGRDVLFFSPFGPDWTEAKRICEECPVRALCLTYALETQQLHGTWGGQNQLELRLLLAVDAAHRPKRYSYQLFCPWCRGRALTLTPPPPRSGLAEHIECRGCGFAWSRTYVPRRGRRKAA